MEPKIPVGHSSKSLSSSVNALTQLFNAKILTLINVLMKLELKCSLWSTENSRRKKCHAEEMDLNVPTGIWVLILMCLFHDIDFTFSPKAELARSKVQILCCCT